MGKGDEWRLGDEWGGMLKEMSGDEMRGMLVGDEWILGDEKGGILVGAKGDEWR